MAKNSEAKAGIPLSKDGSSSKTVVAVLFKLGRDNDKYNKEMKKIYHPKAVVSKGYVENFNKDWQESGKYYEIDKEATKEYYAKCKIENEKRVEAAKKLLTNKN
ncbi:MAG: hypothetical protein ACUZ8H_16030 [Candidatus Anammoxibacter sp.]